MSIKMEEVLKITPKGCENVLDPMVEEYPVTLYLNKERMISLMCTPSHMEELAIGFFYLKRMINTADQIDTIKFKSNGSGSDIYLEARNIKIRPKRDLFELSDESLMSEHQETESYPLQGKIDEILKEYNMTVAQIFDTMETFSKQSDLFVNTGGVHSIGLYEKDKPILLYDDVSRYNTYNKLFGGMLMEKINPDGKMLLTTGRIPSEVMTWIIQNKIKCVLSISAPTSGSVRLARKHGITLMGFVRKNRLNLYA